MRYKLIFKLNICQSNRGVSLHLGTVIRIFKHCPLRLITQSRLRYYKFPCRQWHNACKGSTSYIRRLLATNNVWKEDRYIYIVYFVFFFEIFIIYHLGCIVLFYKSRKLKTT